MVNHITKTDFDRIFDSNKNYFGDKNCILVFSAPSWCGPCKTMIPILEKITNDNLPVYEVDVDEEFELSSLFNIRSVPTIYFISKNNESNIHQGAMSLIQMEKLIQKYFGE